MKNILIALSLVLTGISVSAQENYTIKMTVKTEGLPAEYAAYGEQEITNYIKGEKTKTEISSMMFNSTVYFDGKLLTSLTDAMGNKIAYTATKEDLETEDKEGTKSKIEYTTEKKQIAGYECTKAIVTNTGKDKKEKKITVWVTDKIKSNQPHSRKAGGAVDLGDLKGQPLAMEMSISQGGMDIKVIMTTTEVDLKPVDDSVFVINTEGYKIITYKEMLEKQKSMPGAK